MSRVASGPNPGLAQRRATQLVAAAIVQGASVAATAQEAVDAAISGDLVAASPELAATIHSIDQRLDALETP